MLKKVAISGLLLIAVTLLAGRHLHFGSRSSRAYDEMCFDIKRPYYPLRHWSWSGIFPFDGGFISDPHFLCSVPVPMPDSVNRALGGSSTFQVVDINPFFDDESSEIELLIRSGRSFYEYSLQFPKGRGVRAVIAIPEVPAHIFPSKKELALVADFSGPAKGIYSIALPLRSGGKLALINVTDPEFDLISGELKNASRDVTVRDQFCESRNWLFISFYEKYAQPCGGATYNDGVPAASRFGEFWKGTD